MEKYRDLSRSRSPLDRKSKPESPNPRFQKLVEKMRTLRKMAPVSENLRYGQWLGQERVIFFLLKFF